MKVFSVLVLALALAANAKKLKVKDRSSCDGPDGCCKLGQGDCDNDSDCCNGLKCDYDWGFKTDYCIAGPTTKDYSWEDWSEWTACSVSCGGTGTRSRTRNCIGPVDGGKECPTFSQTQTESCDAPACWTDFGEWSQCNLSCGGTGTQTRSKSCIEPENGGQACPAENTQEESKSCDAPACWTDFGEWGPCDVECGGTGTQTRVKSCIEPENGGITCPAENTQQESQSCAAPACWTAFTEWTACQGVCGESGNQTRSRSCVEPEAGGLPCPEESFETQTRECQTIGLMLN